MLTSSDINSPVNHSLPSGKIPVAKFGNPGFAPTVGNERTVVGRAISITGITSQRFFQRAECHTVNAELLRTATELVVVVPIFTIGAQISNRHTGEQPASTSHGPAVEYERIVNQCFPCVIGLRNAIDECAVEDFGLVLVVDVQTIIVKVKDAIDHSLVPADVEVLRNGRTEMASDERAVIQVSSAVAASVV